MAKRRGIACSMAHAEKGEWEGHDEREEQTREEEGEARGSHTTGAFLLTACHGQASVLTEALHSWRSRIANT